MIFLKPYVYLAQISNNRYRICTAIVIPDDFDLLATTYSSGVDSKTIIVDFLLISVPGQSHQGFEERVHILNDIPEKSSILVRVVTNLDAEDLPWMEEVVLLGEDQALEPLILGNTVVSTIGADEDDDGRGDSMSREKESEPEEE